MIVSGKWDSVPRRSADIVGLKMVEKPTWINPHYLFVVIDNVNIKNVCDRPAMTMSGYSSSPSKIVHEVPSVEKRTC